MATTFTFSSVADTWPSGTSVGAYLRSNQSVGWDRASAPTGAATSTGTVASDGSLAFTGLADDTRYLAGAQVSGTWRFKGFRTDPVAASGSTANAVSTVAVSGDTTGAADTAVIQAALDAARTAGGGVVRGKPGSTYYLKAGSYTITNTTVNALLAIGSNTILDMTDCFLVVPSGVNAAPVVNYSMVSGTVGTASTTSGSSTVTTALTAQVGQSIVVYNQGATYAGGGGISPLCGFVSALGSGNVTIQNLDQTASLKAGGTVAGAPAVIFNRDTAGGVRGGYWNFNDNTNVANDSYNAKFMVRHADFWSVRIQGATATAKGYVCSAADITNFSCDLPNLSTTTVNSDGCHIQGPCYGALVERITGSIGDDAFAITASDYPNKNDCAGNVWGVRVNRIDAKAVVRSMIVIAGPGQLVDDVSIGQVRGWAQNTAGAVLIGDDASQATTTGGRYGTIEIDDLAPRIISSTAPVMSLVSPSAKKIRARINYGNELASGASKNLTAVVKVTGTSTATIDSLDLFGQVDCSFTNLSTAFLDHTASSVTLGQVNLTNVKFDGNGAGCYLVRTAASCVINELDIVGETLGTGAVLTSTAGTVGRFTRGRNHEDIVGRCYTMPPELATTAAASGAANRAYFMRVRGTKLGATNVTVLVGTVGGNISVGVYPNTGSGRTAAPGTAKATTASVAVTASGNQEQTIPLGSTVDVYEGDWVGISLDGVTATLGRPQANPVAASVLAGVCAAQNTAFPVPATPSGLFQAAPFWYAEIT